MKLDIKSFLIGVLSVVSIVLLTGATKTNKKPISQDIILPNIYDIDDVYYKLNKIERGLTLGLYTVECE